MMTCYKTTPVTHKRIRHFRHDCSIGHLDVLEYLAGKGAQVERGANNGSTPLLAASRNGHLDVVQYLRSKQAEKEEASPEGPASVSEACTAMTSMNLNAVTDDNVKRGVPDARASVPQPFLNLKTIMMADLTIKDSSGGKHAFHKKTARKLEGCHLGGGSFGEVYKATHAVHGDVAVKLAKPGKEGVRLQVNMYHKEARKHENSLICEQIVPIKGFVEWEDDACNCGHFGIVMKYMENGSLWDFRTTKWQQHPDLLPLTNRMVYEMSSGMHFLHSKDIIHRDLKLENVLVDGDLHVKIADLGLATNLQTSGGDRCCGTYSHMPPEAFKTDIPNSIINGTPKYDVYGFAMTLYELLTGIHPYSDSNCAMVRIFKLTNQNPCQEPVPKNTPEALIKVMTDSWSYEPNERPHFKEIVDRVERLDIKPNHASLGLYFGEDYSKKEDPQKVTNKPSTDEVDNPSSAREVSDKMLNTLAKEIPIDDYYTFSEKLGIKRTQAKNILVECLNNCEKATSECIARWRNKSRRIVADLHEALREAELETLIVYCN